MFLFNFLKNFLGWADQAPRKRRAVSFSFENEFVTPKKHCCDYKSTDVEEDLIEIDENSDSDDVEIVAEQKYSPIGSSTRLNGICNSESKSFSYSAGPSTSSPKSMTPCHKSNMGYCANKSYHMANVGCDCTCPTLAKTHQLREKNQYQELIQHFLPRRVEIMREKREGRRSQREVVEVIELDKTCSSTASHKVHPAPKRHDSRWYSSNTASKEKEIVITLEGSKKDETVHSVSGVNQSPDSNANLQKPVQTKQQIECVATNSLRDQLSAKAVMRGDFIPQVAKRYNERIEQRYKEVEELKKMTCVLSKHNRLAREAALEEQLARSMRLCEAVLDERESTEEPALPTLTNDMLQEVKNALVSRPPDEILVEGFGLRITRKDIHTLAGLNWLNDEVINFYMNLLIARSTGDKYPKVHAMNTFFYPKLISGGHTSLKRWTRKIDIFAQDLVVVPIHLGIHWCMSIIDFRDKSIRYYDSMGSSNPKCLSALRQYLEDESMDKKKQAYNTRDWKLESVKDIPQQMNGSDCGVFSCMFAEYICANRQITFTQQDMPYFRNKMVYEILKSKLL